MNETTPPTTTDWGLVAATGIAATGVVVLFLLVLKHGGKAAVVHPNPALNWYPDQIGNDWLSSGPRGTFRLTPQPDGQWIVIHLSTKYGPVATLDDAKELAEFLNTHTRSALPRGGKGVLYTGARKFYRTEKIMPPVPTVRYHVTMSNGQIVTVKAASTTDAVRKAQNIASPYLATNIEPAL